MTNLDQLEPHLQALDAEIDGAASVGASVGEQGAAPEDEPADKGAEYAAMLQLAVTTLTPALPFLPRHYTPEVCQRIGVAFDAVARKHGWNLADLMTPELALAAVALPPTIGAIVEGRAYFAAQKAARQQQELRERQQHTQHLQEAADSGSAPQG